MRVGLGYDARAADGRRSLVLLGIPLPGAPGLAGPNGGDLLAVAVAEALLGAAGVPAVERSPAGEDDASPVSPKAAGIAPSEYGGPAVGSGDAPEGPAILEAAVRAVEGENYQVVNVDVTLIGIGSPLRNALEALCARLAELVHVGPRAISVKPGPGGLAEPPGKEVTARAIVLIDQIGDLDALHATIRSGG